MICLALPVADREPQVPQHRFAAIAVGPGIGAELDQKQWRSILRQLVVQGFLLVDSAGYGALRLSESSRPLLRGEIELPLRRDLLAKRSVKAAKRKTTIIADQDQSLFDALRDCRKRIATENNVPPMSFFTTRR